MPLGDNSGYVLYQGQWITLQDYFSRAYTPQKLNIPSSPATGTVVTEAYDRLPSGEVVTTKLRVTPEQQQAIDQGKLSVQEPDKPLEIVRAVRQDNGEIEYQTKADADAQALGIITKTSGTGRSKLTAAQRQQLEDYVKAHPEQQFQKHTADLEVDYYNMYGMPVYKGEKDPLDLMNDDPFAGGDAAIANTQAQDNTPPLVIPFYYGGRDQNMGLLAPGTMVYPMPWDAATIYPQKIPMSMEEDPKSGLYAVGFEGTVQDNIYFDPVSGRFYDRFITTPSRAIDVMRYSWDVKGQQSGIDLVKMEIAEHEQEILRNPLNKDFVKANVTPQVSGQVKNTIMANNVRAGPDLPDVMNLGILPDSPLGRAFPAPGAKQPAPTSKETLRQIVYGEGEYAHDQQVLRQFAISMIPLPGFVSKPIGKIAGAVIGKAATSPVVGRVVTGYLKVGAMSPTELVMSPLAKREAAAAAAAYNNRLGAEGTANLLNMKPTTPAKYNELYGFGESKPIMVKGANSENILTWSPGDYGGPGLKVVFMQEAPAVTRSVFSAHDAMMSRITQRAALVKGVSDLIPGVIPSIIGRAATSQSVVAPATVVKPDLSYWQDQGRIAPNINIEIPGVKAKTRADDLTATIPVQITGQKTGEQTVTKTTAPPFTIPGFMLQTPRYKFNATVPLITSGIKSDPFKIRPFKEKGTYTYKNNPDAILGAIGHGKINIGFPSVKTKSGKRGKKRLLP